MYRSEDMEEEELGSDVNQQHLMRSQTMVEIRDMERLLLYVLEYDHTPMPPSTSMKNLRVVYNVNRDYNAAITVFRCAINVRPQDYQVCKKLGANLANGNHSKVILAEIESASRGKVCLELFKDSPNQCVSWIKN